MQSLLNLAIESIFVSSVAFFAVQFVVGFADHRRASITPVAQAEETPEVETEIAEPVTPQPVAPKFIVQVVPFVRPVQPVQSGIPDYAAMSPEQLRKECQKRGIKWRNSSSNGKHLKKAQMIQRLLEVAAS